MVEYAFYFSSYQGESIPEDMFLSLEARARQQLARYKRIYRVTVPPNCPDAEKLAICALADALHYYDRALAGLESSASVSVGSVSSSRSQTAQPDLSPKAQAAELLRCVKLYLDVERWCGPC